MPVQGGQLYAGKVRPTGLAMLLFVVTFGIYGLVWWYLVHDEMKRHSGQGIGGLVALLLAIFVSPAAAFFTSDEVGKLYERTGRRAPVSALTRTVVLPRDVPDRAADRLVRADQRGPQRVLARPRRPLSLTPSGVRPPT